METRTPLILTGEAARILNVAPDTVRYLERTGRLCALKTSRGVRLFDRRDVERLARKRLKRSGDEGQANEKPRQSPVDPTES